MAIETNILNNGSLDDSVDAKYGVVDIFETGERSLKSSTLESFNKKARSLAAGILVEDDGEDGEDLLAYDGAFTDDEEDVGLVFPSDIFEANDEEDENREDDDSDDSDGEDDGMSDSDTLFED